MTEKHMKLDITTLKPNPYRDFIVDPIDQEQVSVLAQSIEADGFWGGVVATKIDGQYHIVAGHHRIEAAKIAGVKKAEIFVGEFDMDKIVEIYARENATQRGNIGTSQTGSVAGALRRVAYKNLTAKQVSQTGTPEPEDQANSQGIGSRQIRGILGKTLAKHRVEDELKNLQNGGHYTRIIQEVSDLVEREAEAKQEKARLEAEKAEKKALEAESQAEKDQAIKEAEEAKAAEKAAEKEKEAAKKAAEKSEEHKRVFDLEGCQAVFHVPDHVNTFRSLVTGDSAKTHLPIDQQAKLAKAIVNTLETGKRSVTSDNIRSVFNEALIEAVQAQRELDEREKKRLTEMDLHKKFGIAQDDFIKACKKLEATATSLKNASEKMKSGHLFARIDPDLMDSLRKTHQTLSKLIEVI